MALPASYGAAFERLLADVAASTAGDIQLAPFWPIQGAAYNRELLVVGRSVNGWARNWTAEALCDPVDRAAAVEWLRHNAEPPDGDRMAWVTELWGAPTHYNTRKSAFWRVLSRLVPDGPGGWPGRLAWTNLYKVSPAARGNPNAALQRAQRSRAIELLRMELAAWAPRRVLALTGSWIDPFRQELGLTLEPRRGLVEGVGARDGATWVLAKHPMGKPEDPFVAEVSESFAVLGCPLR